MPAYRKPVREIVVVVVVVVGAGGGCKDTEADCKAAGQLLDKRFPVS